MNIYEIHEKTGISIRSLRKLDRMGFLKASKVNEMLAKIRANLENSNPLSAEQILYLLKNPDMRENVVFERWVEDIEILMKSMGDVEYYAMSWSPLGAALPLVAAKDEEATVAVCAWLRTMIDADPGFANGALKDHAYVAVRMFYNVPERQADLVIPKMKWIMMRCRTHPIMENYVYVDEAHKAWYKRPFNL